MNRLIKIIIPTFLLIGLVASVLQAQKTTIAVMTPFLAQPGTQLMVEALSQPQSQNHGR